MADDPILKGVADDLPVGVWVARAPGGEFLYANKMFAEIMGMSARADVAVGEYAAPYGIYDRAGELYPESRMPFVLALTTRQTVTVDDIVIHRAAGRRVNVRATARPIFDDRGELTHVVIAFIDITREVAAETARADTEVRLAHAQRLESIGNLAGGVAHDFNNLLAAIRMLASTLKMRETDPSKLEDLHRIDEAVETAAQLTRALLGFARRGKHRAERISLNDVVRSIAEIVQRTFDRSIALVLELRATAAVIGDYAQLEQVVMNLAMNARDAVTALGGGGDESERRIVLRTRDAGDQVVLEVTDTGTGIDPTVRDRIFEPYFTTKTSGAIRGTGLGLATVYGIVAAHQGRIETEDVAPRGTTMRIWLPAAPGAQTAAPRPRVGTAPPRAGRGRVLVVDDEPSVRLATTRALEQLGYDVIGAADGVEAVAIYSRQTDRIDAVVLDMVMPRLSGHGTYLELKKLRPDVPVLLTTGYALNEDAQAILDLGVRGFLAKPYSAGALSHALAEVLDASPEVG